MKLDRFSRFYILEVSSIFEIQFQKLVRFSNFEIPISEVSSRFNSNIRTVTVFHAIALKVNFDIQNRSECPFERWVWTIMA